MVIYYIKYIFKLLHISDLITYSLHNFSGKQSHAFPENVSFFSLRIQNTFEIDKSVKMPKFKKQCNNPFQEKWSGREGDKVVNLRNRGFLVLSVVFEQYVQAELGGKSSYGIQNLCITCLKKCFTKHKFSALLPNHQAEELKNNVQRQV